MKRTADFPNHMNLLFIKYDNVQPRPRLYIVSRKDGSKYAKSTDPYFIPCNHGLSHFLHRNLSKIKSIYRLYN